MLDHFKVVRLVGSGGFGDVYLARDTRLGRKVALKLIHPRHLDTPEAAERFMFEARATARFSHPNIVTIYAVGEWNGRPYVALEYLPGRTLRERIREGPLFAREAMRIGLAVGRALQEAHGANILHRDLKPENILIPADGRIRVVDFGLARPITPMEDGPSEPEPAEAIDPAAPPQRRGADPGVVESHRQRSAAKAAIAPAAATARARRSCAGASASAAAAEALGGADAAADAAVAPRSASDTTARSAARSAVWCSPRAAPETRTRRGSRRGGPL